MRALRLLLWGLTAFSLTVYAGFAFAGPATVTYTMQAEFQSREFSSLDDACAVLIAKFNATRPTTSTQAYCRPPQTGTYVKWFNPTVGNVETAAQIVRKCPGGEAPWMYGTADQQCTSVAPPPTPTNPCLDKNPIVRRWNYPGDGPFSAPSNFSGCVVTPIEMMVCRKSAAGSYCMWMVKRTGEQYTGPDAPGKTGVDAPEVKEDTPVKSPPIESPPKADDPPGKGPCPTGTVHAGMSQTGIPMCIGTGSTPPAKPVQPKIETEKNETGSDGTVTNTKTVITTNTDGSTTKTVTVTATRPDGTKTTSGTADTSATPGGAAGKSDRPTEDDKYDLCKTNPNLSVCREGSVTGTCGEIQCVGDAVQCATLRAAAAMECRGKADEDALKASPQTALGTSILAGADPMKAKIEETMKGTEIDLSKPGLDQSGFLSGGSCLPNKTMSVMGRSVTVDFAQLCTNIQPLRSVIMACALILAYMIVSRSVLQG
jgi:hypothetical protein